MLCIFVNKSSYWYIQKLINDEIKAKRSTFSLVANEVEERTHVFFIAGLKIH